MISSVTIFRPKYVDFSKSIFRPKYFIFFRIFQKTTSDQNVRFFISHSYNINHPAKKKLHFYRSPSDKKYLNYIVFQKRSSNKNMCIFKEFFKCHVPTKNVNFYGFSTVHLWPKFVDFFEDFLSTKICGFKRIFQRPPSDQNMWILTKFFKDHLPTKISAYGKNFKNTLFRPKFVVFVRIILRFFNNHHPCGFFNKIFKVRMTNRSLNDSHMFSCHSFSPPIEMCDA